MLNISKSATREEIRAAYRALARRWHPDRFMPGPERDWANERMAAINAAYRQCLSGLKAPPVKAEEEDDTLACVQRLIDAGRYVSAHRLLMTFDTRCAEWNYLFGLMRLRQGERDKALIYLTVAAHQKPDSAKYAGALKEAQQADAATNRLAALLGLKR